MDPPNLVVLGKFGNLHWILCLLEFVLPPPIAMCIFPNITTLVQDYLDHGLNEEDNGTLQRTVSASFAHRKKLGSP